MAFYNWQSLAYDPVDEEREIKEQLSALQREYLERAQPLIDRLVDIESRRPAPPVIITRNLGGF